MNLFLTYRNSLFQILGMMQVISLLLSFKPTPPLQPLPPAGNHDKQLAYLLLNVTPGTGACSSRRSPAPRGCCTPQTRVAASSSPGSQARCRASTSQTPITRSFWQVNTLIHSHSIWTCSLISVKLILTSYMGIAKYTLEKLLP